MVSVKIYNKLSTHELRGWKVRLVVNNDLKDIESSNVIGVIEGEQEPDRYIIIGKKVFCYFTKRSSSKSARLANGLQTTTPPAD